MQRVRIGKITISQGLRSEARGPTRYDELEGRRPYFAATPPQHDLRRVSQLCGRASHQQILPSIQCKHTDERRTQPQSAQSVAGYSHEHTETRLRGATYVVYEGRFDEARLAAQ